MTDNKRFTIFSDFDGTISVKDIGETIVNRFGNRGEIEKIIKLWMDNKITSPESWRMMFSTFGQFSQEALSELIGQMQICPSFKPFVEYCEKNSFEIKILSDGYDFYIRPLLEREGLGHIKFYSNTAEFTPGGIIPSFPYGDEECRFCGNCKRNHILTNSADEDFIVYIGDGYSDKCPIEYCDFIFAKKSLLRFCEVNRITYFPFSDFSDVSKRLDELKAKKRLKKRHQATLKRNEIFKQG